MTRRSPLLATAAIAMAIGFNLPYANLTRIYDYPDILRSDAGEALTRFAQGGDALILTWHAFGWSALLLLPLAIALSLTDENRRESETLAIAAAISGALSGVIQAMGLWRWVFVIPALAREHATGDEAARIAAERAFDILNAYGGIAIGEHLGQWLLVFFIVCLAALQWRLQRRLTSATGFATAALIAIGTTEGVLATQGQDGELFSIFTIAGFLGFTLWLIQTGLHHFGTAGRRERVADPADQGRDPRRRA
ncbi:MULTISPECIES: DUF4386 family protein [Hyphobacterium]|uniref:DUF4386 family protein n=1 Tax=Hyphobacterium vulgare TaxID=1736751 RepID=A0ABV6ZZV7_9PROT